MKSKNFIVLVLIISVFFMLMPIDNTKSAELKRITYKLEEYIIDTLSNSATNKLPVDTIFVDWLANPEFLLGDSLVITWKPDSVAGLYGNNTADSLNDQVNSIGIRVQGVIRYYTRYIYSPKTAFIDTIANEYAVTVEDSALAFGQARRFIIPIDHRQMYVYVEHTYADTSLVNAQAKTGYKLYFDLKK